jgi:hypothetical protein
MKLIDQFFARWRWTWVGTVEGACTIVGDDGKKIPGGIKNAYWNLFERGDGRRRFTEIGNNSDFYNSQAMRVQEAAVRAWVHGGPLPTLYSAPIVTPSPKPKAKLIAFPGGKDGAA